MVTEHARIKTGSQLGEKRTKMAIRIISLGIESKVGAAKNSNLKASAATD